MILQKLQLVIIYFIILIVIIEDCNNRPWSFLELVLLMLLLHTSSLVVFLNHCEITFYLENPTSGFA
jgi:hypothetical protein